MSNLWYSNSVTEENSQGTESIQKIFVQKWFDIESDIVWCK